MELFLSDLERKVVVNQSNFLVRKLAVSALEVFRTPECCELSGIGSVTGLRFSRRLLFPQ